MIIDPRQLAAEEYGQPFHEVVAGYASDGEPLFRVAEILHVEKQALREYADRRGIRFRPPAPPSEQTEEARRKISASIRARSPRYCFQGVELTPIEWARQTGIPAPTIRMRIHRGWPVGKAVTTPPRRTQ